MDTIIERCELVTPKTFAGLVAADPGAVDRVIKARELNCEVITEGKARKVFINLDMFVRRAGAEGLTAVDLFKRLARKCKK